MSDHHDHEGKQDMDAVSRAYRAARDRDGMLPPAALDDAIRAAAHRAVHAGPKLAGSNWIRRWTPQLAVAAVVVLSVSVVFVSIEERPDLAPASIQKIALNQPAAPPAEAALPARTRIVEGASPPAVSLDALKKKASAETGAAAVDAQVARQKDAPLLKEERNATPVAPPPTHQLAAAAPVHAPPTAPAAAPPPAPASVAAIIAPAPFPATAEAIAAARKEVRADAQVGVAPEPKPVGEKISLANSSRARDSFDAPAKPAAAKAAPTPTVAANAAPVAQGAVAQVPMIKQLATPAAAATPARAQVADAARSNTEASASAGVRAFSKEDKLSEKFAEDERPGPWLKRLLELREQNKFKELREQLVRFKKAHPDVVLPKVLTELPAE